MKAARKNKLETQLAATETELFARRRDALLTRIVAWFSSLGAGEIVALFRYIVMTKRSRDEFFYRAAAKVARHFRDGSLPTNTRWVA